ncbi:MerR family transcriptional regulator [Nocardia iowensis]|uniref:MerR family transcriptional regulator n=1 Tax=Nocardia iowensis TaxID=204891 RepID=A0ABX8RLF2_NOCIO|nr:MerR family transcriptional regulator [Nocardia iowensis]QXN90146.1 MerR family transcriptional regulator [Nocardia iowensis]
MRIGDLSGRTGVSVRLLRYYEEQQLLKPERRPSGYREYREQDAQTVQHIRTLLAAGLGTQTIAELLPCMVDTGQGLAPACPDMLPDLYREHDRMGRAIADLEAARATLERIIAATPPDEVRSDGCVEVEAAPAE